MKQSVEKIVPTKEELELPILAKTIEITNEMIDKKLCAYNMTFKNGWSVKFQNKRFAKQLDIPLK